MKKLLFVAGLCVIENRKIVLETAERLKEIAGRHSDSIDLVFKASFDKANRTSISSFRGPGIDEGLSILADIAKTTGLQTLTDVHEVSQIEKVAAVVDHLQIPAFLCRQTDMVVGAAKVLSEKGRGSLNIKKGQFLSPQDTANIVEKAITHLPKDRIFITERGSSFGYGYLVVDMTSFPQISRFGVGTIFDATHSVQNPGMGKDGKSTGGRREMIEPLSLSAVAAGADGIFMEVHPEPDKAMSDGANSYRIDDVEAYLERVLRVRRAVGA